MKAAARFGPAYKQEYQGGGKYKKVKTDDQEITTLILKSENQKDTRVLEKLALAFTKDFQKLTIQGSQVTVVM